MIKIPSWLLSVIGTTKEELAKMQEVRRDMDEKLNVLLSDDSQSWCTLSSAKDDKTTPCNLAYARRARGLQ